MTTIFGADFSHYDGRLAKAIVARAMGEGIEFATHKLGEGGNYTDPLAGVNLNAMRDAGLRVIGAYYVPRTPGISLARQVEHCIALADDLIPWWRTHPGFFWQDDVELWDYDRVSAADGKAFGRLLAAKTGKAVALYASAGMYGDAPADWPGIWWNANYGANHVGGFRDVYQGDSFAGWAAKGGRRPDILQYGSKTRIAGLTTCDANAFRGSIDQLLALIGAPDSPEGDDMAEITVTLPGNYSKPGTQVPLSAAISSLMKYQLDTRNNTLAILSALGDSKQLEQTIAAAVAALPAGVTVDEATMQAAFIGALRELAQPQTT